MTADEILQKLAGYAPLEGTDLPWTPNYVDTMQTAFDEYFLVLFELDIPELGFETSTKEARTAYETLKAGLISKASAVYDAIVAGKPFVAASEAVTIPVGTLRQFLVSLNAVTWASFQQHESGAWSWAVQQGIASTEEMRSSAALVYRMWKLVGKLHAMGALNALKKPQFKGTSGLGGEPLSTAAIIAIAIASVAVIAILAWFVLTLKVESNRVALMEETCLDENGKLIPNAPPHCGIYFNNIAQNPNAHLATFLAPVTEALTAAVKSIAWVAGAGVLLYVGAVYVLPAVVGTFSGGRKYRALPEAT